MKNRLKDARETLKLSQADFGKRIGVSGAAVSRWESGERGTPDVAVRAIVREFGVSELWLRTGTGDMFESKSRAAELAELTKRILTDSPESFRSALVMTLLRFDPDGPEWPVLEKIYRDLAAELQPPDSDGEK